MGQRAVKKLLYVHEYADRHGKVRRYFRKPGFRKVPLPGVPGSREFIAAYRAALAGETSKLEIGLDHNAPGSVSACLAAYYRSQAWASLRVETQKMRRAILENFRAEHGDKRITTLPQRVIALIVSRRTPAAAGNWLTTLRGLLLFAVKENYRADDPSANVTVPRYKTDGIHDWTDAEIEQFKHKHPIGSRARLAFALLFSTAQRRGDAVRMGRQHIRNGVLLVRQEKTGAKLSIPIEDELAANLAHVPADQLTFLVTEHGKPFTAAGFGNWFRDQCSAAGLTNCSAHGLRKAKCRQLAEAGCSTHQIAAVSGHKTLSEVQRYTKAVDQERLAREAMRVANLKGEPKSRSKPLKRLG